MTNAPQLDAPLPLNERPHILYRMRAADGRLLYVGITMNVEVRFQAHRDKPWWPEVQGIELEHFASRTAAVHAERKAIQAERPVHNVVHAPQSEHELRPVIVMGQDQARGRLNELARRNAALTAEIRAVRDDLLPAVRDAAAAGVPQVEIVRITDWSREHIRNIVAGKVKA